LSWERSVAALSISLSLREEGVDGAGERFLVALGRRSIDWNWRKMWRFLIEPPTREAEDLVSRHPEDARARMIVSPESLMASLSYSQDRERESVVAKSGSPMSRCSSSAYGLASDGEEIRAKTLNGHTLWWSALVTVPAAQSEGERD
jgi:hypothetical protein